jgi:aspartokinase
MTHPGMSRLTSDIPGASEINISCVIEERDADRAMALLHTNLFTFLD